MLATQPQRNRAAHAYVGGMLNIGYATGFARRVTAEGFLIQQTNNIEHAVPVFLAEGVRPPREFAPVTAVCHIRGTVDSDGEPVVTRNARLEAIDVMTPSTRSMPTLVAWALPLPPGAQEDAFRPFGESGRYKENIEGELVETAAAEKVIADMLAATNGILDTSLGENANTMMLAGIVEAAAIVKATNNQRAYLGIALRQHKDSAKCIPIELHAGKLEAHLKSISVGRPISVLGQARVRLIMSEDGKTVVNRRVYIRCHELKVATFGDDIKQMPDWLYEMRDKLLANRTPAQPNAAVMAQADQGGERVAGL